jgi:hypothetical protein
MNELTKQPSERALKCAVELARHGYGSQVDDISDDQLLGHPFYGYCIRRSATIIDRHCDGLADELAEALRLMLMANGEDAFPIGAACAIEALRKYDETKGGQNE